MVFEFGSRLGHYVELQQPLSAPNKKECLINRKALKSLNTPATGRQGARLGLFPHGFRAFVFTNPTVATLVVHGARLPLRS